MSITFTDFNLNGNNELQSTLQTNEIRKILNSTFSITKLATKKFRSAPSTQFCRRNRRLLGCTTNYPPSILTLYTLRSTRASCILLK